MGSKIIQRRLKVGKKKSKFLKKEMDFDQLVREIHLDLIHVVREMWMIESRAPAWALHVTNPSEIFQVLNLAQKTASHLGVDAGAILTVGAGELSGYWAIIMRQQCGAESFRSPVDPKQLSIQISKSIAGSLFSMHRQTVRHRKFLMSGPPPGVQSFPEYSAAERTKTVAVHWERIGNRAHSERHAAWCDFQQPQRFKSLRSQDPSGDDDVSHPTHFM